MLFFAQFAHQFRRWVVDPPRGKSPAKKSFGQAVVVPPFFSGRKDLQSLYTNTFAARTKLLLRRKNNFFYAKEVCV